jgi:xanthosine utilization system XapX-like protein
MPHRLLLGTAAGAVGTLALDVASYADMALRGRAASDAPARVASALAGKVGIDLGGTGETDERARNRRSAVGALMGYGTGLGVGAAYGLLRPRFGRLPRPVAGAAVGLAAMAASDVPMAALGVSDPRTWSRADWAADLVPHLAYGLATAAAHDLFGGR